MDERFYNVALLQELVDSLPPTLKMQWAFHRKDIRTATMLDFNNWLGEMVDVLSQVIRPVWNKQQKSDIKLEKQTRKEQVFVHVHSADASEQEDFETCLACNNDCSSLNVCRHFLDMSSGARWALVNEKKICKKCLAKHAESCERKIPCNQNGCSYLHHWLLHDDRKHKRQSLNVSAQNMSCNAHCCSEKGVLLKYIPVMVHGKTKSIMTYAFLDAGSTSTLMEHSLWEELNLDGEKSPLNISWTDGQKRREADSVVFSVRIAGTHATGQNFLLSEVHTVRSLDLPPQSMSALSLAKHFHHLSNLPIESYTEAKPRILLGVNSSRLEYPFDSREGEENQPTVLLTRLGWVVYGPCPTTGQAIVTKNVSAIAKDNEEFRSSSEIMISQSAEQKFPDSNNRQMVSNKAHVALDVGATRNTQELDPCVLWGSVTQSVNTPPLQMVLHEPPQHPAVTATLW